MRHYSIAENSVTPSPYGLVGVCPLCPEGLVGLTQSRFDDGIYLFPGKERFGTTPEKT